MPLQEADTHTHSGTVAHSQPHTVARTHMVALIVYSAFKLARGLMGGAVYSTAPESARWLMVKPDAVCTHTHTHSIRTTNVTAMNMTRQKPRHMQGGDIEGGLGYTSRTH